MGIRQKQDPIQMAEAKLKEWQAQEAAFNARRAQAEAELQAVEFTGENLDAVLATRTRLHAELAAMNETAADFAPKTKRLARDLDRARVAAARRAMAPIRARYAAELSTLAETLGKIETCIESMTQINLEAKAVSHGWGDTELLPLFMLVERLEYKRLRVLTTARKDRLERVAWHAEEFPCEREEPEPAPAAPRQFGRWPVREDGALVHSWPVTAIIGPGVIHSPDVGRAIDRELGSPVNATEIFRPPSK
jgi:hypothetical protein